MDLEAPACHRPLIVKSHRFAVKSEDEGLRLDQAIARNVDEISRTLAKKIIAEGGVFLENKRVKISGRLVREGQHVEVNVGELPSSKKTDPDHLAIPIVELSEGYVVIDKPSGVFSAPTRESDRNHLLSFVAEELRQRDEEPNLYLVHRLDRPTSGLMVIARTQAAAASLSRQLADKSAQRYYAAVLVGDLTEAITVSEPVDGKVARTDFAPVERKGVATLVDATLHTGRTHQVRLHAQHSGMPVAGDSKYGRRDQRALPSRPPQMALHATQLRFTDPNGGQWRVFSSPLPEPLTSWFKSLPDQRSGC